jgi:hypothetical protein
VGSNNPPAAPPVPPPAPPSNPPAGETPPPGEGANPPADDAGSGLIILNASASGALSLTGNASITVSGDIHVDSTSSQAVTATGNASVTADNTYISGEDALTGNATITGTLHTGAGAASDPLSTLAAPDAASLTVQSTSAITASATLNPGVYQQGINLSGKAQVVLNPGIYFIQAGGLTMSGTSSISGSGVLLFFAAGTSNGISITGNASVQLSPATAGTYNGITIFEDRTSKAAIGLTGNGSVKITGTVYAAGAALSLTGNSSLPNVGTLDVVDTINITGNGSVTVGN